jgi:hypothetical protein
MGVSRRKLITATALSTVPLAGCLGEDYSVSTTLVETRDRGSKYVATVDVTLRNNTDSSLPLDLELEFQWGSFDRGTWVRTTENKLLEVFDDSPKTVTIEGTGPAPYRNHDAIAEKLDAIW